MISTFRNYAWLVINPISGFAVRLGVTLLFTVFEHKLFFFCSIEWTWYSSSSTLPSHIALWVVILHLHTTGGSCGLPGTDLELHCAHTHIQTTQMRFERRWDAWTWRHSQPHYSTVTSFQVKVGIVLESWWHEHSEKWYLRTISWLTRSATRNTVLMLLKRF